MRDVMPRCLAGIAGILVVTFCATAAPLIFEGRIVPPPGQPTRNYTVGLEYHEGRQEMPPADFLLEQTPAEDGAFRIEADPRSGGYFLYIRDAQGRVLTGYPHLNAHRDVGEIPLGDTGVLMGSLRTPEDEPAAGITARLERKLEARCSHFLETDETTADADGAFAFERLNPGSYRLLVQADDVTHPATDIEITDDLTYLELQLKPAASISGRVIQSDGQPAAGVAVQTDRRPSVQTDDDGRYRIPGLGPGTYRLRVESDRLSPVNFVAPTVTVGATDVTAPDVTVVPVGALHVALSREQPEIPLPARLPIRLATRGERRRTFSFSAPVEADGARFEKLAPGTYQLQLADAALGNVNLDVTIESGQTTPIDIILPEVFTLRGQVVDDDGAPVAEARVMIQPPPSAMGAGDPFAMMHRHAQSDAQGGFSLVGLPRGEGILLAQADGYVAWSETTAVPGDGEDYRITLSRGLTVTARLVDEKGQPVPGATLRLQPDTRDSSRLRASVGGGRIQAESDAAGTVTLQALSEGRYTVQVEAPEHYADLEPLTISAETRDLRDLTLTRGQVIAGMVTEADGTPVTDARIHLHGSRTARSSTGPSFVSRQTQTETDGGFRISGLPDGRYQLRIIGGDTHEELVSLTDVAAGSDELMVILGEKKSVHFLVLDPDDRPVAGAGIELRSEGSVWGKTPDHQTDADGRLRLEVREGKQYNLTVRQRPWIDHQQTLDLTAMAEIPERLEIRLQPGLILDGTVTDADDRPQPGLSVTVGELESVITDAQGQFQVEGVAPGVVVIQVHAEPDRKTLLATQRRVLEADKQAAPVAVTLPRPGAVRGVVRDFDGALMPQATVMLNLMTALGRGARGASYQTPSLADARFEFATVMPGNYYLMASLPGGDAGMPLMRVIEVKAGETVTADLPVDLQPGTVLTITVTHADTPLPDLQVFMLPLDEDGNPGVTATMSMMNREPLRTDADGRFSVENIQPGSHLLRISDAGQPSFGLAAEGLQYMSRVEIAEGQTELDLRIEGVAVWGILETADGQPPADVQLTVYPVDAGMMLQGMMTRQVPVDDAGRFELRYLPREPHRIMALDRANQQVALQEFTPEAEDHELRIRLQPGLRISGTVRREPAGRIENVYIMALSETGIPFGGAMVGPDGKYTIEPALPRGRYILACGHSDLSAAPVIVDVTADLNRDFVLQPGGDIAVRLHGAKDRIAGRAIRIDDAAGEPLVRLPLAAQSGFMAGFLDSVALAPTDHEGRTRVRGLPAGEYVIRLPDEPARTRVTVTPFEEVVADLKLDE